MKKLLFLCSLFIFSNKLYAEAINQCDNNIQREVAFTMDDGSAIYSRQNEILEILKKYDIKGAFAINEGDALNKNTAQNIADFLKKYLSAQHIVFNHTYMHKNVEKETLNEFKQDVLKGENILNKVLKENNFHQTKYFRFPYLRTGETLKKRVQINNFLTNHHYKILPVTIDTRDWEFEKNYVKSLDEKNFKEAEKISHNYLKYVSYEIDKSEKLSCTLLNRNPKHILLNHAKNITVDNLEKIIKVFHDKSYKFITLDDAMSDDIYKIDAIHYEGSSVNGLVLSRIAQDYYKKRDLR